MEEKQTPNYKCVLITSQYYHQHHTFICEYNPETFKEQAQAFTKELCSYKRQSQEKGDCYGDLDEKHYSPGRPRYDVNDAGDIHFELCCFYNRAKHLAIEYAEAERRQRTGYIRKAVTENTEQHHDFYKVRDIVNKHFTIA